MALHEREFSEQESGTLARSLRPAFVALIWLACVSLTPSTIVRLPEPAERAVAAVTADALRAHVEALASDAMAGRGVGHPGNRRAEIYIADALRAAGVAPAAGGSYFQPVRIYQPRLGSGASLTIENSDGQIVADLPLGSDFHPLPPSTPETVSARLVFAGHGISAPAHGHDDYAGLDVRGAIAMVLDEAPATLLDRRGLEDRQRWDLNSLERKIRDGKARGAAALLVVRAYLEHPTSVWPASTSVRSASYRLADHGPRLAVAAVSEQAARPLRAALERGARFEASLTPGVVVEPITVHNVVGMVAGREPGEMVVVGAHLDHDGIDAEGRIYNGADDNASGTAAVLAAAAAFARAAAAGERPARATVFALWNGEEKGSLGAEAFVASPQPPNRVVANINLDMVGRSSAGSAHTLHLLGYSYSPDLARTVLASNDGLGLDIRQEYDGDAQNLLQRSDNWAFLKRGIPAVFFTTGLHPDYHTPDDDADRIDYAKLARITKLASRTAWVAAEGAAPRFTH